jgi:hypothetical protein
MKKSVAELSTELLRSSEDPLWSRLRQLLTEHGVDISTDILADLFPDDVDQEFGVVVTKERKVATFVFHYGRQGDLKAQAATGTIHYWNNISAWWQASPYRAQVEDAIGLLDRGWGMPGGATRSG